MPLRMAVNLLILLVMVATNILSLYHLSPYLHSATSSSSSGDHNLLLAQLHSLRATVNHLTAPTATPPPDLILYSRISTFASSCNNHPDLLRRYMNYTPFSLCPLDNHLAESLILRGCHPLPRRRCFSPTPGHSPNSLPLTPFPVSLPDSAVLWSQYPCKSFSCLDGNLGFDIRLESSKLLRYKTDLDLPIPQLMQIAKSSGSVLRLGLDIGGGTGTFAGRMKAYNVTVVTTTMNFGVPYSETAALRGLVPLHAPLQQRLPVVDGVLDLVRCGRVVNRWIPLTVMEFLFFDVDRVLRGGGYLWLDRFFSEKVDMEKVYAPLIRKLGYKRVKWAIRNKTDRGVVRNWEVYLTALLQKPVSK